MSSTRVVRYTTTSSYNPPVYETDANTTSVTPNAGWSGSNVTLTNTRYISYPRRQYFYSGTELTSNNGIPATRCWASITGTMSVSWTSTFPSGVGMNIIIEVATFGSDPIIAANTASGSYSRSLPSPQYFTGSDVQTQPAGIPANWGNFSSTVAKRTFESFRISGSGSYSFTVSAPNATFSGTIVRKWEGTNHVINGLDGDTLAPLTVQSTVFTTVRTVYIGEATLSSRFSLSENSVSVITGVEKTLENSFSLSAEAKINRFATISLSTQADFSATTYNFRFADPLSLQSDYSLSSAGGIIRNLSSELILSTDTAFTQTAGLIYDISVDYSWDDFAIDGKFTDNLLDGGIQYTWDGVDYYNWETWPNDNWEQTDISWDEWPSDTWNGSERIVAQSNTQNTGNAIRGGIGSLLSTTSLSENAAFRIEGIPDSIRSDFLCDGSPSGLMGGSSTMVSDFIVDSFANYIINNAQNIEGAFDATLLANYIAKFVWSARSDFNLDITPTFKPSGVTNAQCIAVVDALANYKINNPQNIESAFDPEFTARLFFTTDPYQIYRVLQETRQIFVDAESRGIEIPEEIRLNSIPAENRDWLVPQETRNMKLRIPPMVDRTTTPKVRRE